MNIYIMYIIYTIGYRYYYILMKLKTYQLFKLEGIKKVNFLYNYAT